MSERKKNKKKTQKKNTIFLGEFGIIEMSFENCLTITSCK